MPTSKYGKVLAIVVGLVIALIALLSFRLYQSGPRVRFVSYDGEQTTTKGRENRQT